MNIVELKELRSLVAIAELGSISMAAERLHLTPPAIHKQLKVLEAELGVTLYEKIGRRLQLTQAGDVILPYMKDLLAQYSSALSALEEWKGMKRGIVRIGTGPTSYLLPIILKKFRRGNPGVELIVETGNTPVLLDDLSTGSLDLALVVSANLSEAQDFSIEAVWDFEMLLVCHSQNVPLRPRLADLKNFPFILFRKGSRMEGPIDSYFSAHGFEPKVAMRFDNAEFIKAMVRTGIGISMLPLWIVDRDVKDGRISIIRQAEPPLYLKIALVRRKSKYVPRPVQEFIATARSLDAKQLRLLTVSRPANRRAAPAGA